MCIAIPLVTNSVIVSAMLVVYTRGETTVIPLIVTWFERLPYVGSGYGWVHGVYCFGLLTSYI